MPGVCSYSDIFTSDDINLDGGHPVCHKLKILFSGSIQTSVQSNSSLQHCRFIKKKKKALWKLLNHWWKSTVTTAESRLPSVHRLKKECAKGGLEKIQLPFSMFVVGFGDSRLRKQSSFSTPFYHRWVIINLFKIFKFSNI